MDKHNAQNRARLPPGGQIQVKLEAALCVARKGNAPATCTDAGTSALAIRIPGYAPTSLAWVEAAV